MFTGIDDECATFGELAVIAANGCFIQRLRSQIPMNRSGVYNALGIKPMIACFRHSGAPLVIRRCV